MHDTFRDSIHLGRERERRESTHYKHNGVTNDLTKRLWGVVPLHCYCFIDDAPIVVVDGDGWRGARDDRISIRRWPEQKVAIFRGRCG